MPPLWPTVWVWWQPSEVTFGGGRPTNSRKSAERVCCSYTTIFNHFQSFGFAQKPGTRLPHKLSQINKGLWLNACHAATTTEILHRSFTSYEKYYLYANEPGIRMGSSRKKPKVQPDFHPNKLMFSVWWDFESLLHWELLPMNRLVYFTRLHQVGQII